MNKTIKHNKISIIQSQPVNNKHTQIMYSVMFNKNIQ